MKQKNYILIFSIIGLLLLSGCGKKGDPTPVMLPLPGGINDLFGEVKDGLLFLSFTVPQKNRDGSEIKDLAGFRVFKKCGTCTGDFEAYKNISLEEKKGYTIANGRLYIYDDDLMSGFNYSYKIYPYTKEGTRGDASNVFTAKWDKPPDPPKGVTASVGNNTVTLSWPKEAGYLYNVYRFDNDRYPLFPLNKEALAAGSFTDSALTNEKIYVYEVRKVKPVAKTFVEGTGARITATPKDTSAPAAPRSVKAEKKGSFIFVTWKENTEKDLAGYNIYRIAGKNKTRLNRELTKDNSFLDKKLPDYRFVSYFVTAVDTAGNESEPSQESIVVIKE